MKKLILTNAGISILTMGIQFILVIFTNRILGPEGRGIVASLISWNNLYYTLGYLSLHIAIINLLPKSLVDVPKFLGSSILSGLLLGGLVFIIGYTLFQVNPTLFGEIPYSLYLLMILIIPVMLIQSSFMSILQMVGELNNFNYHGFIYAIFQLLLTGFFLVFNLYTLDIAIYIVMINYIFSLLLAYYFIRKKYKTIVYDIKHLFVLIKVGIKAHIASVGTFLASSIDILMINSMIGKKEAGIYFLAVMIGRILLIVPRSVQTMFYYKVSVTHKDKLKKNILQATRITVFFMILISIVLALFSKLLVFILGGEAFSDAQYIVFILLPGLIFLSVPMVLASVWNNLGIFKYMNISISIMVALVIMLNYYLIPRFGIYGAAFGTTITYLYLISVSIYFVNKFLGKTPIQEILVINKNDLNIILNKVKK